MFIQQVGNNSGSPDGDRRYTDYNLVKARIYTTKVYPLGFSVGLDDSWFLLGHLRGGGFKTECLDGSRFEMLVKMMMKIKVCLRRNQESSNPAVNPKGLTFVVYILNLPKL